LLLGMDWWPAFSAWALPVLAVCAAGLLIFAVYRFVAPPYPGAPWFARVGLWRWLFGQRYWWFQRKKLADLPSCIYEGLPGSGKTLAMVRDVIPYLRQGYRVGSNLYIRDALTGAETVPCRSWLEMLELTLEAVRAGEPLILALDEIHNLCDAREWANTPAWWRNMMSQKRHFKLGLIGTTQALGQVEKRLRSLVAYLLRYERLPLGRMAFFRETLLDPTGVDVPGAQWATRHTRLVWVPWYAFHSYSTWQVMASDDMTAYSDDALKEKIAAMIEELQGLCDSEGLPAFADCLDCDFGGVDALSDDA